MQSFATLFWVYETNDVVTQVKSMTLRLLLFGI